MSVEPNPAPNEARFLAELDAWREASRWLPVWISAPDHEAPLPPHGWNKWNPQPRVFYCFPNEDQRHAFLVRVKGCAEPRRARDRAGAVERAAAWWAVQNNP